MRMINPEKVELCRRVTHMLEKMHALFLLAIALFSTSLCKLALECSVVYLLLKS